MSRLTKFILAAFILVELSVLFWGELNQTPSCAGGSGREKRTCFTKAVTEALNRRGITAAYKTLNSLHLKDPSLSDVCHTITHVIGAYGYKMYKQRGKVDVSPDFATCSYGFYHGFMTLMGSQPDAAVKVKAFCQIVDQKMKAITPDANLQCYHGIGHGFTNNHDPRTWGSEEKMIGPALALCEQVAITELEKRRCTTGVFNSIAFFYNDKQYNLVVKEKDPFWICRRQKKEYQDACYLSLNITLLKLTDGNLQLAAKFLGPIPDDTMATHAMINLAAPVGTKNISSTNHLSNILVCRSLAGRLAIPCIQGYAFGMLEQGNKGKEYIKPLEFCGSTLLTTGERDACYRYIIGYLPQWYSAKTVDRICKTAVPANHRGLCEG